VFAKLKTLLRKAEARTVDAVSDRIRSAAFYKPSLLLNAPAISATPDMLRSNAEGL
jgi:hypothetical protein